MYKTSKYTPTDKMSYLICDNYTLLQVMSRFDLSLGFGDKTVQEVCRENGVDCRTFLAVVNFMIEDRFFRYNSLRSFIKESTCSSKGFRYAASSSLVVISSFCKNSI